MAKPDMVKVELRGPDGDIETLWATPLGDDRYRLENSPFLAYGVSYEDIIEARAPIGGDFPCFVRRLERSGNRTLRLILKPSTAASAESQRILDQVVALGGSCEGMNSSYLSINIPPHVDLNRITEFLVRTGLQWEYVDPTYEEIGGEADDSIRVP